MAVVRTYRCQPPGSIWPEITVNVLSQMLSALKFNLSSWRISNALNYILWSQFLWLLFKQNPSCLVNNKRIYTFITLSPWKLPHTCWSILHVCVIFIYMPQVILLIFCLGLNRHDFYLIFTPGIFRIRSQAFCHSHSFNSLWTVWLLRGCLPKPVCAGWKKRNCPTIG